MGVTGGNSTKFSVTLIYILQTKGEIPIHHLLRYLKFKLAKN